MNEGILLASDIDFMIHGIFKVKVFGQEVWITDSHACILIVMAVMVIFAVIANRKLKHADGLCNPVLYKPYPDQFYHHPI